MAIDCCRDAWRIGPQVWDPMLLDLQYGCGVCWLCTIGHCDMILYISCAAGREESVSLNAPRLLIILGQGARLQILEEFVPLDSSSSCCYLTNATAEFELAESSSLQHGCVASEVPAHPLLGIASMFTCAGLLT